MVCYGKLGLMLSPLDFEEVPRTNSEDFVKKGAKFVAFKIGAACISCGVCMSECAVEAISEGTDHYTIDADVCIDCGACADVCPEGAISEA